MSDTYVELKEAQLSNANVIINTDVSKDSIENNKIPLGQAVNAQLDKKLSIQDLSNYLSVTYNMPTPEQQTQNPNVFYFVVDDSVS